MRQPRSAALTSLLLAGLALTAGCGSDDDADSTSGGSSADQRLRYAYAFTPVAALSPYSDDAVISYGAGATQTLAALAPSGEPEPQLATSWKRESATRWTFTLRQGVIFQDGTAMDAKAVAASLTHATQAKPLPRALTDTALTITAVDDGTVAVTTREPDPVLVQRLTSPELVILSPAAYDDPDAPDPVGHGTGPYEITELNGTSGMTLDAFDDFRGDQPRLAGVDVSFVADGEARASAFRAGQVDLAQALPASSLGRLQDDQLLAVPLPRTVSVHLTQDSPVFSDPALRSAARAAIADVDLADTVYDRRAEDAEGLFNPDVSPWAEDQPEPTPPTAAKPDGQSITLATFSDRPELVEIATALADSLRGAGFMVKTVVQEYNQLEEKFLDGTYDAVIMSRSYGQDTADPVTYLQTDYGCQGSYDISQYCSGTVDRELSAAASSADASTREKAALEVQGQLLDQVVVVPLVHDQTQFGVDGVDGLARDPWERAVITAETTLS